MEASRPKYSDVKPGSDIPEGYDIIELKYDGMWGRSEINYLCLEMYSRQGKLKYDTVLEESVPNVTFVGEYLYASHWAESRGLKNHYFIFDILRLGERDLRDLPLRDRKQLLHKVLDYNPFPKWFHEVKYYPVERLQELWNGQVIHAFFEGVVFKNLDGKYGDKWARMKREFTIDYVFMGVSKSDKFERDAVKSILGGLYVDGELKQVCKVGGLTHAERYEFWDRQGEFKGKVFEAKGKGLFRSGALRHPNFVKWRDDKLPEECVIPGEKLFSKTS